MVNRDLFLSLVIFLFFFTACTKYFSPSEYVNWVKDEKNGLNKVKQIKEVKIEIQHKPIPFIIANEQRKNDIDIDEYNNRKAELEGLIYFDLRLSINLPNYDITNYNILSEKEQKDRLYYLSYHMKNDIFLIEGMDTLPCRLYHFERSYDIAKHRTFILAFDNTNHKDLDKTVVLDTPLFNTGPIKLKFKKEDLINLPLINL